MSVNSDNGTRLVVSSDTVVQVRPYGSIPLPAAGKPRAVSAQDIASGDQPLPVVTLRSRQVKLVPAVETDLTSMQPSISDQPIEDIKKDDDSFTRKLDWMKDVGDVSAVSSPGSPLIRPGNRIKSLTTFRGLTSKDSPGIGSGGTEVDDALDFAEINKSPTNHALKAWRGGLRKLYKEQPAMQMLRATSTKVHWRDVYDEEFVSGLSEIAIKKLFLIKVGRYLYEYGCPVKRVETALSMAASVMNVQGNFAIIPGLLIASIGSAESSESQTLTVKMSKSLDMFRLQICEDVVRAILKRKGDLTIKKIQEDLDVLDDIASPQHTLYPRWVRMVATGVYSASSVGFFGGSWPEALISFFLGLTFVGGSGEIKDMRAIVGPLLEFLAAAIISFFSQSLASLRFSKAVAPWNNLCFWSMALSSTCWSLPGLSITTAVMELSNGSLVPGTVNLFYAVLLAMILGFGFSIGSGLALWTDQDNLASTCPDQINIWLNNLFIFPIWNFSMYILLHASPNQWPPMFFVTMVGYAVYSSASLSLQGTAPITIAAFVMTLLSFLVHRVRRQIHVVPLILAGIMFLLPGGIGVRGASSIARSDFGSGSSLGFQMVQTALSIAVGIFAATPFMQLFKLRRTKLQKNTSIAEIF